MTKSSLKNESGITPVGISVLILPEQVEEKTSSGIIVMTEKEKARWEMKQHEAQVIAIAPNAYYDEKEPRCKVGDYVIIAAYSGILQEGKDGKKYRLVKDDDIVAILDKGE